MKIRERDNCVTKGLHHSSIGFCFFFRRHRHRLADNHLVNQTRSPVGDHSLEHFAQAVPYHPRKKVTNQPNLYSCSRMKFASSEIWSGAEGMSFKSSLALRPSPSPFALRPGKEVSSAVVAFLPSSSVFVPSVNNTWTERELCIRGENAILKPSL